MNSFALTGLVLAVEFALMGDSWSGSSSTVTAIERRGGSFSGLSKDEKALSISPYSIS